jgi:predicted nuclease of predicted toxin-antitoxin system
MPWRPLDIPQEEVDAFTRRFKEKAVFYLDEPVGPAVGEMLSGMGYKVRTAAEAGLAGHDDADHAALCWRDEMILVTHDRDFLNDSVVPQHRNPGIVVLDVADGATAAYRAAYFLAAVVGPFGQHWRGTRLLITAKGEITIWVRNAETGAVETMRMRWLPNRPIEGWQD